MSIRLAVAVLMTAACHTAAETRNDEPIDGGDELRSLYQQSPTKWPPFAVDETVEAIELGELADLPPVSWQTPETKHLGRMLFFDPRLSQSQQIACANCHDSSIGWGDGRTVAFGHDRAPGPRNSMTLLNVGYFDRLFWDGRADGLLDLIPQPIQSEREMNADMSDVVERIEDIEGYPDEFEKSFGTREVNAERISKAISAFVRSIRSRPSRFDWFLRGRHDRLSDQEIHGLHVFRTKANCMNCHHGPLFSDGQFHHTGLSYAGRRFEDLGRYYVTGIEDDGGRFRTPTLRDLRFTGPWMHNGLFTNFSGIIRMYNHGMTINSRRVPKKPELSPLIRPLNLTQDEMDALESFLNSLSQHPTIVRPPPLPGRPHEDPTPKPQSKEITNASPS